MKKKLFVLLVILAVVLTGVFAEDEIPSAKVLLKGSIGAIFKHGVIEDGELLASKTFSTNLLDASGTTFSYGYLSNQDLGSAKLYMSFTDFVTEDNEDSIQIGSITVGSSPASYDSVGERITIFSNLGNNGAINLTSTTIKVVAAQTASGNDVRGVEIDSAVAGATDGEYTATLTFNVVTD